MASIQPVATRLAGGGTVTADQIGAVAAAASAAMLSGREIRLHDQTEVDQALGLLGGTR